MQPAWKPHLCLLLLDPDGTFRYLRAWTPTLNNLERSPPLARDTFLRTLAETTPAMAGSQFAFVNLPELIAVWLTPGPFGSNSTYRSTPCPRLCAGNYQLRTHV